MESYKAQKVLEAKERMQDQKKKLQAEKQIKLTELKSKLAEQRPGGNKSVAGIDTLDHIEVLDIEGSPMKLNEEIEVISPTKKPRRNSRASSNSPKRHGFSNSV